MGMKTADYEAKKSEINTRFESQKSALDSVRESLTDAGYHEGLEKVQLHFDSELSNLDSVYIMSRDVVLSGLVEHLFEQMAIYNALLTKLKEANPDQMNKEVDQYSYALGVVQGLNMSIGASVKTEASERKVEIKDVVKRIECGT